MTVLNKIGHYLIYSNIFVAVAALCLSLETQVLFGHPIVLDGTLCLIFFATLFVYNISRIQVRDFSYHKTTIIAFAGCLISLCFVPIAVVYISVPLGLVSLSYSLPLMGRRDNSVRLREIPLLKIFLIAIVWGFSSVLIPVLDLGISVFTWPVLLLLLRRMLFVFAITIPFDIRDQVADARDKLQTLPGTFGSGGSKGIAIAALVLFACLLFVDCNSMGAFHLLLQANGRALLLSAAVAGMFVLGTNKSKSNYYYLFFLDGTMILQFLLVYFWGQ